MCEYSSKTSRNARSLLFACLLSVLIPSVSQANTKYYVLDNTGPTWPKYSSAATICENYREYIQSGEDTVNPGGSSYIVQLPDENVPPDLKTSTTCIVNWSRTVNGELSSFNYTAYIYAGFCDPGQTIDLTTYQCSSGNYYLLRPPPDNSEPTACTKNNRPSFVGDPINVANGAVVDTEGDCSSSLNGPLSFTRYYDSSDKSGTNLGPGWRGRFSRHVVAQTTEAIPRTYAIEANNPTQSSKYPTAADACTNGFIELRPGVTDWSGASTVYVDGICELIKNGLVIGSIPVYSTIGIPRPSTFPTPIVFNFVRDDGQVVRSWIQGTILRGPEGTPLRVTQSSSSFTYVDTDDNVELYDSAGVLQSITSRAGVVQTMGYDAQGRLSTVTDSFGHKLIFSYDTQNRMQSVTRQ